MNLHESNSNGVRRYYRRLLPKIYLHVIFWGLAITGATFSFLPSLYWCSKFFGENECDPIGRYIIAFASLPGLPVAGNIDAKWTGLPPFVFFLSLTLSSLLVYYIIGLLMDKFIKKEVRLTPVQKLILTIFVGLAILMLVLSSLN